jgi:hypothetical protein
MKQKSLLIVARRLLTTIVMIIVLVAAFALTATAQDTVTGAFEGTVVDSVKYAPIAGASVRIVNEITKIDVVVHTDSKGRFYQGLLPPGMYKLHFSAAGYISKDISKRLRITYTGELATDWAALDPEQPQANEDQNRGGIAVAALPNALVQVETLEGSTVFKRVIPPDQLLCVFDDLPSRDYKVSATLDGYQPAQKEVTVLAHKTVPLTLNLLLSESSTRIRAQAGKYYALIIGNNDYQQMTHLLTAENDAKEIEKVLRERYGFETRLLLNASRGQVMKALGDYRRTVEENSNLLIYYAGHGYKDRELERTYWLPIDAGSDDAGNWISSDDITSSIRGIRARHVLVISDSCYSGTLARGAELFGSPPVEMTGREKYLFKISAGKSRMLMASGGDEPVEDSGSGGHSVFANALLTGLTQTDTEIFIGLDLYRNFVAQEVSGKSNQNPEYSAIRNSGHESGDFIFIRKK